MKNLMFSLALVLLTIASSYAQKVNSENVPAPVLSAFKAKFVTAVKVKWSIEKANEYEAEFKMDGLKKSANFKSDGTWIETEIEINISQLPQVVIEAINKRFSGCKIDEAEQAETPENTNFYGVTIELNEKEFDVDVKPNGEIINAVEVKENEKD